MARVLIGADICPIGGNQPYFESGDAESLFRDLLPEFESAALVVANLECPLIARDSPIRKTGPTFGVPEACIKGIKNAGIQVLCLANNHSMDHGEEGLRNTIELCRTNGIDTVGAGENLQAAGKMLVKNVGNVKIGLLAGAEREFSIATNTSWGANPLDVIECARTIRRERGNVDAMIVLFHGGDEFHIPTPRVQKTCRFLVEQGASAVIVQHPHVLGGWEEYEGACIVYGQGALLMDELVYRDRASFHEGFLVELTVEPGGAVEFRPIPFRQSDPPPGAGRLNPSDEGAFHHRMALRSAKIALPDVVEAEWREFCEMRRSGALSSLLGFGSVIGRLSRLKCFDRFLFRYERLLSTRNMVLCETHREKLETLFESMDKASRKR